MTLVFVYGTLKRGYRNRRFMAGQQFLGEAHTEAGYILFSLGKYPGMVRSAEATMPVVGELWSVDAEALKRLDEFEGVDEQLYARVSIKLAPPFAGQAVETYLYLRDLTGKPIIGSEWRE